VVAVPAIRSRRTLQRLLGLPQAAGRRLLAETHLPERTILRLVAVVVVVEQVLLAATIHRSTAVQVVRV
jgi:hypothetical protein